MNVWNAGLTRAVGSRITHTFRVNGARLARNASSVAQQQLAESIGAAMQHPMGLCPNPATAWQQHNERGDGYAALVGMAVGTERTATGRYTPQRQRRECCTRGCGRCDAGER